MYSRSGQREAIVDMKGDTTRRAGEVIAEEREAGSNEGGKLRFIIIIFIETFTSYFWVNAIHCIFSN